MTEFEKMRREEFYDFTSEECLASYIWRANAFFDSFSRTKVFFRKLYRAYTKRAPQSTEVLSTVALCMI